MKKTLLLSLVVLLVAANPAIKHLQLTQADLESEFPSMVWTGSQLGIAWMDGRDGNQEVYFRTASVDAGLPGVETRLTSSATWDDNPNLTWTGSEFALSWVHENKSDFDLMFQRLDPTGKPRGPAKALIRRAMLEKNSAVCWTGAGFGVVAGEFRGGPAQADLTYRFLDDAGNPQGPAVDLATEPGIKVPAALLRSGSDFSVVYLNSATGTIHLLRLNPFGRANGPATAINLPGARCGMPAADNNDSGLIAAWPQQATPGSQVVVTIINRSGDVILVPSPVTTPGPSRPAVAVAAAKDSYGVAWIELTEEGRALFFVQLDTAGRPVGAPVRLSKPRPVKATSNNLAMAVDSTGYVIAWVDLVPPINSELILSRVAFQANPESPPTTLTPPAVPAAPVPAAPGAIPSAPVPVIPAAPADQPDPIPAPTP